MKLAAIITLITLVSLPLFTHAIYIIFKAISKGGDAAYEIEQNAAEKQVPQQPQISSRKKIIIFVFLAFYITLIFATVIWTFIELFPIFFPQSKLQIVTFAAGILAFVMIMASALVYQKYIDIKFPLSAGEDKEKAIAERMNKITDGFVWLKYTLITTGITCAIIGLFIFICIFILNIR